MSGPQDRDDVGVWPPAGSPVDLELLQETDALLDRLGARTPTPDDLDDPIAAALAVFAAGIDLDPVPVARTRRALSADGGLLAAPHPSPPAAAALAVDRELPTLLPAVAHGPTGSGADPTGHAAAVDARGFDGSGGEAGEVPASLSLRLLPLLAVTGSAVLLSMGAAAAVSGGQSVNPAQVVRFVVGQVQGTNPVPGSPETVPVRIGQPGPGSGTPAERPAGGPSSPATGGGDATGPYPVATTLPTAQISGGPLPAGASPAPSDPVSLASDQPVPTDSPPSDPGQTSPVPTSTPPGAGSPSASGDPSPVASSSAPASPATSSAGRHGGGHSHSPRSNHSSRSPLPSPSPSHD